MSATLLKLTAWAAALAFALVPVAVVAIGWAEVNLPHLLGDLDTSHGVDGYHYDRFQLRWTYLRLDVVSNALQATGVLIGAFFVQLALNDSAKSGRTIWLWVGGLACLASVVLSFVSQIAVPDDSLAFSGGRLLRGEMSALNLAVFLDFSVHACGVIVSCILLAWVMKARSWLTTTLALLWLLARLLKVLVFYHGFFRAAWEIWGGTALPPVPFIQGLRFDLVNVFYGLVGATLFLSLGFHTRLQNGSNRQNRSTVRPDAELV